jgi:hypothetical protein
MAYTYTLATWTRYWSDGTSSSGPVNPFSAAYVNRNVSVKRKKPVDLIGNRTAWHVDSWFKKDAMVTRAGRESGRPFRTFTESIPVSMHTSLGMGSTTRLDNFPNMEMLVRNKLLGSARNSGVNLANMLGEYRQAAKMFGSLVQDLYRITMAVKHLDPRILTYGYYYLSGKKKPGMTNRTLRNLSSRWLEYVYGVSPLMQDMDGVMKELKTRTERPIFQRLTESRKDKVEAYYPNEISQITTTKVVSISETFVNRVSAVAYIKFRNDILNSALGAYGFTNPASVAWELTPFSFIIDWWVNVGEVLGSLDNCLYIDGGSTVQFTRRSSYDRVADVLGTQGSYSHSLYDRKAPEALGTVASLHYKPSTSLNHIANGLALVTPLLLSLQKR